jgi:extradiol dioxygenase family protein
MENGLGWPTWVGVVCDDLDAQRRFYADTIGLQETGSGDGWVHFDIEGNLFELIQRESLPQYDTRRYQVGFTVKDIHTARRELIAAGAEPISDVDGEEKSPNAWCYFRDPEGNVFEITQWLDRTPGPT